MEKDKENNDIDNLKAMVKEVNETQVMDEEILSDSVYYFDRKACELSVLGV